MTRLAMSGRRASENGKENCTQPAIASAPCASLGVMSIAKHNDSVHARILLGQWADGLGLPGDFPTRQAPQCAELLDHAWKYLNVALGRYPQPADRLRMLAVVALAEDFLTESFVDSWYMDDIYLSPFDVHYLHSSEEGERDRWLTLLAAKAERVFAYWHRLGFFSGTEATSDVMFAPETEVTSDVEFLKSFRHAIDLLYELSPGARTVFAAGLCDELQQGQTWFGGWAAGPSSRDSST